MQKYTVQSAQFKTEKAINGNPMHIYGLAVFDPNGQVIQCEILQRPTTPAPTVGEAIEGEMRPSSNPQFPPALKRAQKQGGGGGGKGYGPEDIARITRSHSQEMALRFFEATGGAKIDYTASGDALTEAIAQHLSTVQKLAAWFDRDVSAAADRVKGGQQPAPAQAPPAQQPPAQQAPPPQQAAPAPAEGPPPQSDEDIPF
jgi:hypothetical protein